MQNFNSLGYSSTTYPAGWQGWIVSSKNSSTYATDGPNSNVTMVASAHAATKSGNALNYKSKIGFKDNGNRNVGLCLAISTTGKMGVPVAFAISTIRNPKQNSSTTTTDDDADEGDFTSEVSMQYRVGTSGSWNMISGLTTYRNNTTTKVTSGDTSCQNRQIITCTLPSTCNNASVVQLRWFAREVTGGKGGRPSFAIDSINVGGGTTTPTTASTSLTFSDVTATQMRLTWTNGNGANRIVVAKTSAITGTPADTNTYAANSTFGSGSTIATSEYVVYNGSGNSVLVTGLTASTTYYFSVIEYNGSRGTSDYYTASTLTGNATTSSRVVTNTIATTTYCVNASTSSAVSVPFTTSGTFVSGNVYTVQLSNSSGAFTSPTSIGTYTSTANSGTISATIPRGTTSGTGYRIRITSSNPAITGSDNGANITLTSTLNGVSGFAGTSGEYQQSVLSWTNPTGCFDEVVIIARRGSTFPTTGKPTGNGSSYSANLNFGSGTSLLVAMLFIKALPLDKP
ncbi:MAG: hypothetical protein NTX03_01015 [Bacteroidetes bacterium]|nr:hypothetical protein [Bacteroidota bacterium]